LKDYLGGMTVKEAARLRVTRATLSRILNGHAGITAGMSLRLSSALGTSPEFWLKMQLQYDLWHARKKAPKVQPFPHIAESQTLRQ
jgi:addiction module HigA family antidote